MAKDDGLDVFDVVAGRFDGGRQALRVFVLGTREHIRQRGAPFLPQVSDSRRLDSCQKTYNVDVLCTAGLEENEADVRVLYQSCQNDEVSTLVLWILVAHGARIGPSEKPNQLK